LLNFSYSHLFIFERCPLYPDIPAPSRKSGGPFPSSCAIPRSISYCLEVSMAAASMLSLEGAQNVLGTDVRSTVTAALCLGALFHLSIRKVEVDYLFWHYLALSTGVFSTLVYAYLALGNCSLLEATAKALLVGISFNTGLTLSIAAYRLFFHLRWLRCTKSTAILSGQVGLLSYLSRFRAFF